MPSLTHTLQGLDFGYLRIVAETLGMELQATSTAQAVAELVEKMQDRSLLDEVVAELPDEGRTALRDMLNHNGACPGRSLPGATVQCARWELVAGIE
jgi:hypothetical protein